MIFKDINQSQEKAIKHIDGPMLILAGAGSGKTKTITTRLAYLIDEVGIPAQNTLTLTFTNKAANIMKIRALNLMKNSNNQNPLLCTFHKFGLLFLRMHIEKLGRKNNFIIIDTEDRKKIIKELIDEELNASNISNYISYLKNHSKNVEMVFNDLNLYKNDEEKFKKFEKLALCYKNYQNYLLKNNFVDFDDLLMLSNEILESDHNFAKEQSELYRYITVDEYQDTNALQYQILKNLCLVHENICVVGDDDQSIYGWRGAKIENILNFQSQFKNVKLVKLEQNYRSVGNILNAANKLIKNNDKRLGKELICTKDQGEQIKIDEAQDEKEESLKIAKHVKTLLQQGVDASEIAVLFRINALSRALEEALNKEKIPFKLLSGIKFYERAEIKDIISYLRLLTNLNDDYSLKRIINRPRRNFGSTSLKKLEDYAQKEKVSLFEALNNLDQSDFFSKKTQKEIHLFLEHIKTLKECNNLKELIYQLEEKIKLKDFYQNQVDSEDKISNIDEFYASLKDKIKEGYYENLDDILNEIALLSDQDDLSEKSINIMSIHSSKGLEFDHVFIMGLEQGIFPLLNDTSDIEEERRLAYVAITRAKKYLYLSFTHSRFHKGTRMPFKKSQFLEESCLNIKSSKKEHILQKHILQKKEVGFKKGDLIKHKIFGIGRVIDVQTSKNEQKLSINFGGITRNILSSFVEKVI